LDISKGARGQDGFTSSVVVQVDTLQKILERQSVPNDFDLLSIDTEGYDYAVIRGMDLSRFRPRVIITERNANDDEKFNYLKQHGYRLQCDLEYDTVWISPEYLKPVNAD